MIQNFRSAFRGFNRDDVVHYLEYINNKHTTEINQLQAENDLLSRQLDFQRQAAPASEPDELTALQERCTQLEAELAEAKAALELASAAPKSALVDSSMELEAYRRAELTERRAKEFAQQLYRQTETVLSAAAAQVDGASEQVSAQMLKLQRAVAETRQVLQSASDSLAVLKQNDFE